MLLLSQSFLSNLLSLIFIVKSIFLDWKECYNKISSSLEIFGDILLDKLIFQIFIFFFSILMFVHSVNMLLRHLLYKGTFILFQGANCLPTSQTCFFQLRLPNYPSKELLAEKLRYAIFNCRSIDMDNYMLTRNAENEQMSDEDIEEEDILNPFV